MNLILNDHIQYGDNFSHWQSDKSHKTWITTETQRYRFVYVTVILWMAIQSWTSWFIEGTLCCFANQPSSNIKLLFISTPHGIEGLRAFQLLAVGNVLTMVNYMYENVFSFHEVCWSNRYYPNWVKCMSDWSHGCIVIIAIITIMGIRIKNRQIFKRI